MRIRSGVFARIQPDCRTRGDFGALKESGDVRAEDEPLTQRRADLPGPRGEGLAPADRGSVCADGFAA